MSENRKLIRIQDLDPEVFFQKEVNGKCIITATVGGTCLDHQLFDAVNNPNVLGLDPINGVNALEVDRVSASGGPCILSQWHYDEVNMVWIEKCDPEPPIATLNIPAGQLFDDVDINFGYIPHPDCTIPVQTDGVYTIYNNNDVAVASGTGQFAGTFNFDFSPFVTPPLSGAEYPADFNFRVEYTVSDICGTSNTVEKFVIVEPYLKQVFTYTGADQTAIAPAWANNAEVKVWGAGGGSGGTQGSGGAGGYAEDIIPTEDFTVVVGDGGVNSGIVVGFTPYPYGFGGRGYSNWTGSNNAYAAGGGLSGVFSGLSSVVNTDTTRALVIAGGGGGGRGFVPSGTLNVNGAPANGPGDTTTLQGADAPTGAANREGGGGGGGFNGGAAFTGTLNAGTGGAPSRGGSGLGATLLNGVGRVPPNTTDPDYVFPAGYGRADGGSGGGSASPLGSGLGGDGLAVITWTL